MPLPNTFLCDPADMTPEQRLREIAWLLATAAHRLLINPRYSAAVDFGATDSVSEVSPNQLDVSREESVYPAR